MSTKYKLEQTFDYSIFVTNEENRQLHNSSLLRESMSKHGFLPSNPIHVRRGENGKYKIIRGHNRFCTAVELGLPVWFIASDDSATLFELEGDSRQSWQFQDFVAYHAKAGNDNYDKLRKLATDHGFSLGTAAKIVECTDSTSKLRALKRGEFVFEDSKRVSDLCGAVDKMKTYGVQRASGKPFVSALIDCMHVNGFSLNTLVEKLRENPALIKAGSTKEHYLEQIDKAYNFRSHMRVPLAFEAKQLATLRKKKKA